MARFADPDYKNPDDSWNVICEALKTCDEELAVWQGGFDECIAEERESDGWEAPQEPVVTPVRARPVLRIIDGGSPGG
jgi:hypothetical protein